MSKRIVLALALGLTISSSAFAGQPSFKVNSSWVDFKGGISAESLAGAQEELAKQNEAIEKFVFVLYDATDADIAAFAQAFPAIKKIYIKGKNVASIASLAGLTGLTEIEIEAENLQDLSPLANLVALESIEAVYDATGKDLSWMSKLNKLKTIKMNAKGLASTQGLPSLPNLKSLALTHINVADLVPLAQAMPNLENIDFRYAGIGDLSALGNLPNLKKVNFYAATLKDFSPLAKAGKLEKVEYYAVQGADFSTLGTLTQVKVLDGGLTNLDSLAWIQDMPKLKHLRVFAEGVTDYTPLKNAPNLDYLEIWKMKNPVGDLAFLTPLTNLTELRISANKGVRNFEAIGNLTKLQDLTIIGNNKGEDSVISFAFLPKLTQLQYIDIDTAEVENLDVTGLVNLNKISLDEINMKENQAPLDLSSIKNLPKLMKLSMDNCNVTNFGALANLPKLAWLDIRDVKGITDFTHLKSFTSLRYLTISKGAFTEEQLAVVPSTVSVRQY